MCFLGDTEAMVAGSGLQVRGRQSSVEAHEGVLLQQAGATKVDSPQIVNITFAVGQKVVMCMHC